jgi:hypothetical protein
VIRFSAALVAVAIGVLIGGIATSKLLLVYIAIVVSAVALLALAIGVVVKREELFGEGQGLVPAGAGAAPVLPARTSEGLDQPRPVASVPPSASFQGPAAGHGSPFDGTVQAAPPVTAAPPAAANPAAPRQAPDGQERDRVADPAPPWEAQPTRDQWSSPPLPGSTTAAPAPDWMPGGRGTSDPVGQAEATAPFPSSTTSPEPSASSGPSSAGPDSASPNWFAPRARSADAAPSATEAPADPPAPDEDENWPARYSWLDDKAGESLDETDQIGAPTAETAVPVAADAGPEPGPGEPGPGDAKPVSADPDPEPESAEPEPEPEPAELGTGPAEPQAEPAASEPPSAEDQDPEPGDDLVAVLPGVPRYHQPDCVLIRFLPESDVQRLPAAQAKADGCTPCAACQPAE